MKRIGIIIIIILLPLVIIISARNIIVKNAVSKGVKTMTGLDLNLKSINIGIFKSLIGIKGLNLYNPSGFTDRLMVNIPEIYVDYDLGAFLKKKVHFEEMRLNLKELVVVKNKKGQLNLNALKVTQAKGEKKESSKKPKEALKFKIDVLQLKIGKVIFKDYSQGPKPQTKEFNINIDERYKNITDPYEFSKLVITKALMNTTIGNLANIDLGPLKKGASDALKKVKEEASSMVNKALSSGAEAGKTAQDTINKKKDELINTINKSLQLGK